MSELQLRIMTGICLCLLIGLSLFTLPPFVFSSLLMIAWCLGIFELIKLAKPNYLTIALGNIMFISMLFFVMQQPILMAIHSLMLLFLALLMLNYGTHQLVLEKIRSKVFIAYGSCFTLAIAAIWLSYMKTPWHAAALFAITAMSDMGGYFVGKRFGKRKLCPAISPGKTMEGTAGGVISVLVFTFITTWIFKSPIVFSVVIAVVTSGMAVMGDLLESWIKRIAGAKDSGHILPGHGGVLDRIDALILAAPVYYIFLQCF